MTQHTPGPWSIEDDGDGYLVEGIIRVPSTYDEYTADARLIAAAPELLAALVNIVEDLEARWDMNDPTTNPGIRDNVARAKEVISKAVSSHVTVTGFS